MTIKSYHLAKKYQLLAMSEQETYFTAYLRHTNHIMWSPTNVYLPFYIDNKAVVVIYTNIFSRVG